MFDTLKETDSQVTLDTLYIFAFSALKNKKRASHSSDIAMQYSNHYT